MYSLSATGRSRDKEVRARERRNIEMAEMIDRLKEVILSKRKATRYSSFC